MKTLADINSILDSFSEKYGMPGMKNAEQLSAAWFQMKLGVISASNAAKAVAKLDSDTRSTYMAKLISQVCTGEFEEIDSKHMEWGHQNENKAKLQYEFERDAETEKLPFVFKDTSFRVGCSPDAIVNNRKGMEIKCPYNSLHYIQFLTMDKVKPEYKHQAQFTMWCLDAGEWDMVQFDPRMPKKQLAVLTLERDPEAIKVFEDMIPRFIMDMDAILKRIDFKFGDQWIRIGKQLKNEVAS